MPRGAPVLTGKPRTASGRRDCLVTIQSATDTVATSGVPMKAWADMVPAEYMNRLDVRADERFAANQDSAFMETIWQMPYRADMDPDIVDVPSLRRLVYLGRAFNIRAATNIGRMHGIELLTLAGARIPAVVS